jgi:hypothetical protein
MDTEWRGYIAQPVHGLTRGAPVLKWAAARLRVDKALVLFLVWSNPTNLCFASPTLQADADVVAAALASQFYAEPPPPVPPSCVLRFAAEELRASKEVVLAAVARSCYDLEFAGELCLRIARTRTSSRGPGRRSAQPCAASCPRHLCGF